MALQFRDRALKYLQEREESISEFQQRQGLDKPHHIKLCSGKLVFLRAHSVLKVASVLQEVPNITQPHFNFLPGIHTLIY